MDKSKITDKFDREHQSNQLALNATYHQPNES